MSLECPNEENMSIILAHNKLQGYDNLDEPPKNQETTHEEFLTSLTNLKFISATIPNEPQLELHFDHTGSSSIKSSTNELIKAFDSIAAINTELKPVITATKGDLIQLAHDITELAASLPEMIQPEIVKMMHRLQQFLVEQMGTNFTLVKEVAIIKKENEEMKKEIEEAERRLGCVESHCGIKRRKVTAKKKEENDDMMNLSNESEAQMKIYGKVCEGI